MESYLHDGDLVAVSFLLPYRTRVISFFVLGAVYQDLGNTCFTFLVSQAHHQLDKNLNSKILLDALRSSFDIQGDIHGRNDLVYGPDKRKFSGSAYQNTRQFALHHGTLITHVDTNAMKKYLNPNKEKLLSKGVDSVQARVINLCEVNPSINHQDLCLAIEKSYRQTYSQDSIPSAEILSRKTLDSIPELLASYKLYSDEQWRFGQTFSFTHEYEKRFPWGTISIGIISERDGLVHTCEIYSDSLFVNMINRLKENLTGHVYTGENIRKACQRTREQVESEQEKTMIDDIQSWILTQI
jgi:lipoate-protein ligase A